MPVKRVPSSVRLKAPLATRTPPSTVGAASVPVRWTLAFSVPVTCSISGVNVCATAEIDRARLDVHVDRRRVALRLVAQHRRRRQRAADGQPLGAAIEPRLEPGGLRIVDDAWRRATGR